MIQKDAFDLQKMIRKPVELRILFFSNGDFYDRLWQNNRFGFMICTTFWKKSRSKETSEEPLQLLPTRGSKLSKM